VSTNSQSVGQWSWWECYISPGCPSEHSLTFVIQHALSHALPTEPCQVDIYWFLASVMRLSGYKILLLLHPNKKVGRREIPSGIKLHWPPTNKSSMSAGSDAVQVVRDYAGANNEIIKMKEIALSIVEAARVCGYCWSTLCFLTWSSSLGVHHLAHHLSLLYTFKHLGMLMDLLP